MVALEITKDNHGVGTEKMEKHRLDDVYGVARELPQNYVVRDQADGQFVEALARDQQIVVYGSSKQGKTCLRKYNLRDEEYCESNLL